MTAAHGPAPARPGFEHEGIEPRSGHRSRPSDETDGIAPNPPIHAAVAETPRTRPGPTCHGDTLLRVRGAGQTGADP